LRLAAAQWCDTSQLTEGAQAKDRDLTSGPLCHGTRCVRCRTDAAERRREDSCSSPVHFDWPFKYL